jgi:hypothetical protein
MHNGAFLFNFALKRNKLLARTDSQSSRSIASRIKQMAWSDEYLEGLLFQSGFAAQTEPVVADP